MFLYIYSSLPDLAQRQVFSCTFSFLTDFRLLSNPDNPVIEEQAFSNPDNPRFMDNYNIAEQFSLLGKLMDIHGENSFKAKSYSSAAFAIERIEKPLADMPADKVAGLKGIGDSTAKKIAEIVDTGELKVLQDLIANTPSGVLDMMNVKGLGPKKLHTIWKEMGIDGIDALEQACHDHRIAGTKGFGERTEQKILESIAFIRSNEGRLLYKQVEDFATALNQKLASKLKDEKFKQVGEAARQLESVDKLEWVTTASAAQLKKALVNEQVVVRSEDDVLVVLSAENLLPLHFHLSDKKNFAARSIEKSGSADFIEAWSGYTATGETEEAVFESVGLPLIPAFLREKPEIFQTIQQQPLHNLIQTASIKGLIHSHSKWSDGSNTLEEMARELIDKGFEYLVISDHSKAAAYASGMDETRVLAQQKEIDALNAKLKPFRIFKSVECDILGDGNLDYSDDFLKNFDLVIASIHSNLDMEEDKAMMRLMGAINNPHTTIMGHLTGRLLLRRKGYPVDHKAIIDACAERGIAIEINANPWRLDIDWRWIDYAIQKGVMLSINPDAHSLEDFAYVKYGVLVAQKAALPTNSNLSSFNLKEFENWLAKHKKQRGLVA